MGQTWGLGLPEVDLCPGEEVGDSAVVGSLVPLIPEDLCEELTWDHQAFHWPWGEDPEGWVVRWDSHPPHLQSLPALSVGAADAEAAAAESASFVSASWLRQWLQRDLESSEEGARWNSVSASGGAVDSEGWGSRHFTSGRLWGPFVRLVSHQQAPSALARRGSNPKPFLYRISMNA